MSQYAPEILQYDANNPQQLAEVLAIIHDPDGPLAAQAGDDPEYRRILEDAAVSEIRAQSDPDDYEKQL